MLRINPKFDANPTETQQPEFSFSRMAQKYRTFIGSWSGCGKSSPAFFSSPPSISSEFCQSDRRSIQNARSLYVGFLPNPTESHFAMMPAPTFCNPEIKLPRNMAWYPGFLKRWLWEREQIILAIAKGYCLIDSKAHLHQNSVHQFLPQELRCVVWPTPCQMTYVGAPKTSMARLRKGNLSIEDKLRPWMPEFFLGLRLSGGLQEKEAGRFRVNADALPELTQDIDGWNIAGKLGRDDGYGRRRLVGCLVASHLPIKDPLGESVIAGLFAGANMIEIDGEQWLEFPAGDQVKSLLDSWTILYEPSQGPRMKKNMLRASPFFAALFVELMPNCSKQRILSLPRPARCPLLPVLYWDWLYEKPGMRILPFADALPFGCSRRTFYRRGWKRKELLRKAVAVGLVGVDQKLRVHLNDWFQSQRLRNGTACMVTPTKALHAKRTEESPGGRGS